MTAGAGLVLGVVGQAFGFIGGMKTAAAEKKAEKLRMKQMELEAMRKKREVFRTAQIARADLVSNATAGGAQDSSALSGGLAGVAGDAGRKTVAVNQDLSIGRSMFKANAQAAAGRGISAIGNGLGDLGGLIQSV